jgi:hypothetical protein
MPIVNHVGVASTDLSSSYQAQIAAYKLVRDAKLLKQVSVSTYLYNRVS